MGVRDGIEETVGTGRAVTRRAIPTSVPVPYSVTRQICREVWVVIR